MNRRYSTRRIVERVLAPLLLGWVVGCGPFDPDSDGCGSPPQATDAAFYRVLLRSSTAPCTYGREVPQGTNPHVIVTFNCPGTSKRFLLAVSVDGKILSMGEVACSGSFGQEVRYDAGPWEAADTTWHRVQVVIDPLNLFKESDESNNRGGGEIRMVAPDAVLDEPNCGFVIPRDAGGDGYTRITEVPAGTAVEASLVMTYGGPYEAIARSVRSVPGLDASDTLSAQPCPSYYGDNYFYWNRFVTRWTPPGPGIYDVEFKIEPLGTVPDLATNNVVTKRLTVTSAPPARLRPTRSEGRP